MGKIKIIFGGLSLLVIGLLLFLICKSLDKKNQTLTNIQTLPNFHFKTLDGVDYSKNNITENRPVIIIYFNSECEHCIYEVKEITKNIERFSSYQIILTSSETTDKIIAFKEKNNLRSYSNIAVLQTNDNDFYNTFGTLTIPSVFIYNEKHLLTKHFKGEVKIDAIQNF
jgi:peroxiredoxin